MAKRGTPEHPKTLALADELAERFPMPEGIALAASLGLLERLWHLTARYAPAGNIGRFTARQIARRLDWPADREADDLVGMLVSTGWIDVHEPSGVLVVHDWAAHADDACKKSLEKAGVSTFHTGEPIRRENHSRTIRESFANDSRLPSPALPSPAFLKRERTPRKSKDPSKPDPVKKQSGAPDEFTADQVAALDSYVDRKGIKLARPLAEVLEDCLLWHRANGKKRSDWVAAGRGWIKKELEFSQRNGVPHDQGTVVHRSISEIEADWQRQVEEQKEVP